MPPRYAYWTIIAGGLPTAFRAAERDELLPTFHRLRERHPDATLQWFARGRLWASPEDARADLEASRRRQEERPRGGRTDTRGRDWRPGGEHRDPRQPYRDAKKARNADLRRRRFERRREKPGEDDRREARGGTRTARPFGKARASHTRRRSQGSEEPSPPPRPRGPNREPRPGENPQPTEPPRPAEPSIPPPGPPERGRRRTREPR